MENLVNNTSCPRCGHKMTLLSDDAYYNDVSEFETYEHFCPNCGTNLITYTPEDDERDNYQYWKDGSLFEGTWHGYDGDCPICGSNIVWCSDFMRSEVWGDVDENDLDEHGLPKDDSLVSNVYCPHCGSNIEIVEAKPSEIEHIYFWFRYDVYDITNKNNTFNEWCNDFTDEYGTGELGVILNDGYSMCTFYNYGG